MIRPDLPAHARPGVDRNRIAVLIDADPPREEQLHLARRAELEEPGVLEKERPLLGEEQIEAREVDLLVVDFDLREVRVERGVEREAGRDSVLEIQSGVAFEFRPVVSELEVLREAADHIGQQLQVALALGRKPVERAGQADLRELEGPRCRRPQRFLVPPPQVAGDVEPPNQILAGPIAQRAKRDLHLRFPAAHGHLGAHAPHGVPIEVGSRRSAALRSAAASSPAARSAGRTAAAVLSRLADLCVVLDPRRRGAEDERVLPVVKRVEQDLDRVGVEQLAVPAVLRQHNPLGVRSRSK